MKQNPFFETLQESTLFQDSQLEVLMTRSKQENTNVFSCALDERFIDEQTLLKLSSTYTGLPFKLIDKKSLDFKVSLLIPESFAREHFVCPLFQIENTLTIGLSNPFDTRILEELEFMTQLSLNLVLTLKKTIGPLISYCYSYQDNRAKSL